MGFGRMGARGGFGSLGVPLGRASGGGGGTPPVTPTGKAQLGMQPEPGMFKNYAYLWNSLQSGGGYAFPGDMTADGYPKNGVTLTSSVFGNIAFPSNCDSTTQFVLKWRSGTGAFQLSRGAPGFTVVSTTAGTISGGTGFNLVLTGTQARVVFTLPSFTPGNIGAQFPSGVTFSGNFGGLVLCRLSDESALDAATKPEDQWADDWVSAYAALNPGILRMMGMTNTNFGNVSQYRYIPNWQTGLMFCNDVWQPGAWAGVASAGSGGTTLATWSPTDHDPTNITVSNSNLTATRTTGYDGNVYGVRGSIGITSGTVYAEFTPHNVNTSWIGLANSTFNLSTDSGTGSPNAIVLVPSGTVFLNGGLASMDTFTDGDVVGIAVNRTTNKIWFRVNAGTWNGDATADPAAGTGGFDISSITGTVYPLASFLVQNADFVANFGQSSYAHAAPSGYGNWQASGGASNTYTVAAQPDATASYVQGEMIQLQWGEAYSGASQIEVASGARPFKPVRMGGSGGDPLTSVSANELGTLTYDKVTDAFWYQQGGQTASVPYELLAGLSNRLNAHLWVNFPTYVDDTSVTQITNAVKGKLNSGLSSFFEYGNEIWNFQFPGTHYLYARGTALGFPTSDNRPLLGGAGLRVRQVMALVSAAWGASRLTRVLAWQYVAGGDLPTHKHYLMEGADLNGTTYPNYAAQGFSNYDTAPNRPIDYCDALAYAPYYNGSQLEDIDAHYTPMALASFQSGGPAGGITTGLLGAADAYAAGGTTNITNALNWVDWDLRQGTATDRQTQATLNDFATMNVGYGAIGIWQSWENVAASYDAGRAVPLGVYMYENAMQAWYPSTSSCTTIGMATAYGGPTGKIATLLDAYKKDARFKTLVQNQWSAFMAMSHSKQPTWFLASGAGTGINPYSLFSGSGDVFTGGHYASYDAFVAYNH